MHGRFLGALALVCTTLALAFLVAPRTAYSQRTFQPSVGVTIGGNAVSLRAGDLDGDGDTDLAAANGLDNTVSVLLNKGSATFWAPVTYASSLYPTDVMLGDFDGDGDLDIASTNQNYDKVSIFRNRGNGTFDPEDQYPAGGPLPASVATGDLDGDGELDLAVGLGNFVSIMLNHGGGEFPIPTLYVVSAPVVSLRLGDLDRDGDLDVVAARSNTGTVAIMKNNGNGFFQAPASIEISDAALAAGVAVGDVDTDGDLDIVAASAASGEGITETISVLLNDGSANFATAAAYRTGDEFASARDVELHDMDGDGFLDIIASHTGPDSPPTVAVLYSNRGDGTFRVPLNVGMMLRADYPMPISAMTVADFNGDGQLDIAASGASGMDKRVSFALNRPWLFSRQADYVTGVSPVAIEPVDLDGDADYDLVVANRGDGTVAAHFNNGDGTFAPAVFHSAGSNPNGLTTGDIDGDGDADVAVVRSDGSSNPLTVYWNDGSGAFPLNALVTLNTTFKTDPLSVAGADIDGDADLDIVTANSTYRNLLLRNDGNDVFAVSDIGSATANWDVAFGDVDGDGDQDYVADSGARVAVRKNNGNGTFAAEVFRTIGWGQLSLELTDLDGDLDLDIAMALNSTGVGARSLNDGTGAFAAPLVFVHGGGKQAKVVAADFDGDGDNDLACASYSASNVTILMNNGAGNPGTPIPVSAGFNPRNLGAADFDGDGDADLAVANETSGNISILFNNTVATAVLSSARTFTVAPNYPNPFNPSTTIEFQLPVRSRVSAQIIDVRGRRIRTLLEGERPQGAHVLQWNGRSDNGHAASSGVYFLRLLVTGSDGVTHAKVSKMVLLK